MCRCLRKICEKMTREFGIPLAVAREVSDAYLRRFRRNVENPRMSLDDWRLFLWVNALGEEYEEFAEEIYGKWKRLRYRNLGLGESTLDLLKTLRKEYQIALITNGPSNSQWEKIRELNLEEYFDCVVISGDVGCEKPEPSIFRLVCSSLGVQPFECLIVGDKLETDIAGGFAAGLGITVWLPRECDVSYDLENIKPRPDFLIRNVTDLLGVLGRPKKNERPKLTKSLKPMKAGTSQSHQVSSTHPPTQSHSTKPLPN